MKPIKLRKSLKSGSESRIERILGELMIIIVALSFFGENTVHWTINFTMLDVFFYLTGGTDMTS